MLFITLSSYANQVLNQFVDNLFQNVINEPETAVTISGSGFGTDDSKVSFKVGDNDCSIDSITDTEITCTLGALRKGPHQIVLTVDGKGECLLCINLKIY